MGYRYVRYALNYKKVNYRTEWTDLLDIETLRKSLNAGANRKHPNDGTDFYTLPLIIDHTNNHKVVGDSFEIAVYLDSIDKSNDNKLIPDGTRGLQKALNLYADAVFTPLASLFVIPFNPATEAEVKQNWAKRWSVANLDDLKLEGEKRVEHLQKCKAAVSNFAKCYQEVKPGPFLHGHTLTYADFVVGGWLQCIKRTVPEWQEVMQWDDGIWADLLHALEPYTAEQ